MVFNQNGRDKRIHTHSHSHDTGNTGIYSMDSHTVTLVERMYWQHGYTVEDIAQRLRLTLKLVKAITSIDYVDTEVWDEDTARYMTVRTKRTRAKEREPMIFPQLPRRIVYEPTVRDPVSKVDNIRSVDSVQAPLRPLTADHGFEQQGHSTGPAAGSSRNYKEDPIDWFARDAIEFYALCTVMTVWIVYWYGVHRGAW